MYDKDTGSLTSLGGAQGTYYTNAHGIDGSNIVGDNNFGGFLYDGTNWITINAPGNNPAYVRGIDGDNLVGFYFSNGGSGPANGFLYNMTTHNWTTLNAPGASNTWMYGISGNKIVGSSDNYGNFVYEIPEPATILLLGLGGLFLKRKY